MTPPPISSTLIPGRPDKRSCTNSLISHTFPVCSSHFLLSLALVNAFSDTALLLPATDIILIPSTDMLKTVSIQKLSNELLKDVLDHIEADPDRAIPIDRRAYLSVESFRPPSPPLPPQAQTIGNFRLTCRRFADLGTAHQFTRIATRFSKAGFQRLDNIASRPNLAKHTKKFSYLIPFFYVQGMACRFAWR